MNRTIAFPVYVLDSITREVSISHSRISEETKTKLISKLSELWLFVYSEQVRNYDVCIAETNPNSDALDYRVHLHKSTIENYKIRIGNNVQLRHKDLISLLKSSGTLTVNDNFSSFENNSFTKSYGVTKKCFLSGFRDFDISIEKTFSGARSMEHWISSYPSYEKLIRDAYCVSIDVMPMFEHVHSLIGTSYKNSVITKESVMRAQVAALRILVGNIWFKVSDSGRFFSSISNLFSPAVQFLTVNGMASSSWDASNSQPLLLSSLPSCSMIKSDCEDGTFYAKIQRAIGIDTYDQAKNFCYKSIFFGNKKITKDIAAKIDSVWPGLSEGIETAKKKCAATYGTYQKKSYRNEKSVVTDAPYGLWYQLQKIESAIWVDVASKCPFTVAIRHDQIVFDARYAENVKNRIEEAYAARRMTVTLKSK